MEIPKQPKNNNEETAEKLKNAYEINQKMETEAELLGVNLQILQDEIDRIGGPEKFRELADSGLQRNSGGELHGNRSDGEKKLQEFVSKYDKLVEKMKTSKKVAMVAGIATVAGVVGMRYGGAHLDGEEFMTLLSGTAITLLTTLGTSIASVARKIQSNKEYIKTRALDMKLDITGSENRIGEKDNYYNYPNYNERKLTDDKSGEKANDFKTLDDVL